MQIRHPFTQSPRAQYRTRHPERVQKPVLCPGLMEKRDVNRPRPIESLSKIDAKAPSDVEPSRKEGANETQGNANSARGARQS